jgi:hypothetical protein
MIDPSKGSNANRAQRVRAIIALTLLAALPNSYGQGTLLRIRFEGPPLQPPGTASIVQEYFESGMWFRPIGSQGFVRRASGTSGAPDNGTTYVQALLGSSLAFSFTNGSVFDLASVDLADYSTVSAPGTVHFVGYRHDGTVVTTDIGTGGINFHTVYFDSNFTGLDRVEIPNYGWSLDNLVVSIPEPGACTLLLTGALLLIGRKLCR